MRIARRRLTRTVLEVAVKEAVDQSRTYALEILRLGRENLTLQCIEDESARSQRMGRPGLYRLDALGAVRPSVAETSSNDAGRTSP